MAIYKGGTQIRQIYKGSTPISKVYKGSTLIWQRSQPYILGTNYGGTGFYSSGKFNNTSIQGGTATIYNDYMQVNSDTPVGGYPIGRIEATLNPQGCNRLEVWVDSYSTYWNEAGEITFAGQTKKLPRYDWVQSNVFILTPTWTPQTFKMNIMASSLDSGYGWLRITKIRFYDA